MGPPPGPPPVGYPPNYDHDAYTTSSYPIALGHDPSHAPGPYQHQPCSDNTYYYNNGDNCPNTPVPPPPRRRLSFARIIIILLTILLTSMCLMALIMWSIFGNYIPEFEVAALSVSGLDPAADKPSGTWDVALSICNIKDEETVDFDGVESSLYYKEEVLGTSRVKPFQLPAAVQQYFVNYTMCGGAAGTEMSQDVSQGRVVLNLNMTMEATFKKQGRVCRIKNFKLCCANLHVTFSSAGEGTLEPAVGKNSCFITMWKL